MRITYSQLDTQSTGVVELFTHSCEGAEADELTKWFADCGVPLTAGAICEGTRINQVQEN